MEQSIKSIIEGFSEEERKLLLYKVRSLVSLEDDPKPTKSSKRLVAYVRPGTAYDTDALQSYLKAQLPVHMLPSSVQLVDEFPYLPNGKIDKDSLKKLGVKSQNKNSDEAKPNSEIEQKLIAIWEEVLAFAPIVTTDNFFEIGGDSILSIQIVAKARKAGIQLSPNQLFENQTIGELALFAKQENEVVSLTAIEGGVALTPIQHWFFELHKTAPHYWNQIAELIDIRTYDPSVYEEITKELTRHHDALRLSFKNENEQWSATVLNNESITSFYHKDISGIKGKEQQQTAIIEELGNLQSNADLSEGGLFKCVYFEVGEANQNKVYLVAHHLVTDMISWNIIQSDFKQLLQLYLQEAALVLDQKVATIKSWADHLSALAQTAEIQSELPYWESQQCDWQHLPVDHKIKRLVITEDEVQSFSWELDTKRTHSFAHSANELYRTKPEDLLITALVRTIGEWANLDTFCFGMERHGRTADCITEDVSNTVGWFTSYFPVGVNYNKEDDLGEQIKSVKEKLRKIPNNGIGYGILKYLSRDQQNPKLNQQPPLVFNYLGNQARANDNSGLAFKSVAEGSRASSSERSYLLEINSMIKDGKLLVHWSYAKAYFEASTVEQLAGNFGQAITDIIQYCENKDKGEYTPSDFPEANISQEDLDNLLKGF